MKDKKGKLPYRLLDPLFVEEMVKVLEIGAQKYAPEDWRNVPVEDYLEASYRHLQELLKGKTADYEDSLHHAAHLAVNMMFIYNLMEDKNADTQLSGHVNSVDTPASSARSFGPTSMPFNAEEKDRSWRNKVRESLRYRFNSVLDHCRPFECTRAHLVDVLIRECFESLFSSDHAA